MLKLTIILTSMLMAFGVSAAVFTWIDDEGEVHYSDKPEVDGAVRVDIESKPTNDQTVAAERQQAVTSELERQQQAQENRELENEDQQFDKEDQERIAKNCQTARQNYETYYNAPRLYRPTADGGREYLSGAEMDAARATAQAEINKWCG